MTVPPAAHLSLRSHSLPPAPLLVPRLGALVRYVVFIFDVVVGTTLLFSLMDHPFALILRTLSRLLYPDMQYIFVDFSTRTKTRAADPPCFYFPVHQIRSPWYYTDLLIFLCSLHRRTYSRLSPTLTTARYDDILLSSVLRFKMAFGYCPSLPSNSLLLSYITLDLMVLIPHFTCFAESR